MKDCGNREYSYPYGISLLITSRFFFIFLSVLASSNNPQYDTSNLETVILSFYSKFSNTVRLKELWIITATNYLII